MIEKTIAWSVIAFIVLGAMNFIDFHVCIGYVGYCK